MELSKFDKKIEILNQLKPMVFYPENIDWSDIRSAAVFVNDTLELSLASAQSIFGNKVEPEVVLGLYDRTMAAIREHQLHKEKY